MYGLTTEGYKLAASIIEKAEVTIIDETLQMALDVTAAFLKKNPDLEELMSQEPLLSIKPPEQVLGDAQVIFFTPKLRRPSDESLIEAGTKLRDLCRYLPKGSVLVNTLPTGLGGNSENVMMVEKQTGFTVGDSIAYAYMPLQSDATTTPVLSANSSTEHSPMLVSLGFHQMFDNIYAAELSYATSILDSAVKSVTRIELAKKAREASVSLGFEGEPFVREFARHLYDLRAIHSSEESGESIVYLAGASLKSLENFVRYIVDETRELLKKQELKASRTKIILLWHLDGYEMRSDRMQMAENIQQRLKDYVTDVELVKNSTRNTKVLDPLKHNVVIVCSKEDHEAIKQIGRGFEAQTTVILATPSLTRQ
jgi:hypothetical protein